MRLSNVCGLAAVAALAACAPVEDDVVVEVDPVPGEEAPIVEGGLIEREPDTCKLPQVAEYVGQPATVVPSIGLTRPYRVVGPTDIVTQEYNPARVNFYTSDQGLIIRVSCG